MTDVLERESESSKAGMVLNNSAHIPLDDESKELTETIEGCNGNTFLRRLFLHIVMRRIEQHVILLGLYVNRA